MGWILLRDLPGCKAGTVGESIDESDSWWKFPGVAHGGTHRYSIEFMKKFPDFFHETKAE